MKNINMDFLFHTLMVMTICFVTETAGRTYCSSASGNSLKIARKADDYLGSTKWAFTSKRRTGMHTDKDHIFVAEVVEWAGASVPHKHWYSWSPVTATDWGNSRSSDLTSSNCWNLVTSCYKSGDVIAGAGHVGIVTGKDRTTHATRDKIVKESWGFANGEGRTVWRYVC